MTGLLAACGVDRGPYQLDVAADTFAVEPLARRVLMIDGFAGPESVTYDSVQDAYFVSNMNGDGATKDGNGFIIRIDAARPSRMETFVRGGVAGVTLHAPKGMAIAGDVLWVADIDALRSFDRSTGAPVHTIDLSSYRAVMLTDIALGSDGSLYVTDTGAGAATTDMPALESGRVFVISRDGDVRVHAQGVQLGRPTGIAWDGRGVRWLVAAFEDARSRIYTLEPDGSRTAISAVDGAFGGVASLPDGRFLATSWSDRSIHLYMADGTRRRIAGGLEQPGDPAVDTRRNRVVVPLVGPGRIEIWELLAAS